MKGEVEKPQENHNHPLGGGQVAEIYGSYELEGSQGESPRIECSKSREVKSRSNLSHPSKEDRWKRSEDLMNSKVHRVRAQGLSTPSHEKKSHEVI
jgi:hypothetical protein